ncbi:ATP-binding cassette domain-containing protein [Candidatus Latescibacterota bacterium]
MVLKSENLALTLSGKSGKAEKIFGGVSFELPEGETGLVSGGSGSGKTLLGLSLCGFLPLWAGEWKLDGTLNFLGKPLIQGEIRTETGIVLENPYSQISGLKQTVFEELAFPLECRGIKPEIITGAVHRISNEFEISALLQRNIKTLSGGELQRIIIASALISGPRFLFLDRLMTEIDTGFRPRLLEIISSSVHDSNGAALLAEDPWLIPEHRFDMTVPLGTEDDFDKARIPALGKNSHGGELLSVESLSFGFGDGAPVLENVSFTLSAGDLKCISGPNGAGKTTLARLIAGIIEPLSGEIVLDGKSFGAIDQWEKMALSGMALQDPGLHLCRKTVREELALAEIWGNSQGRLTEILGLDKLLDRHPLELSQAEKKRLGMALSYGERRKIIILDEPSQYQDSEGFGQIISAMNYILGEGKGVLLITHDPRFDGIIPDSETIRLSRADIY